MTNSFPAHNGMPGIPGAEFNKDGGGCCGGNCCGPESCCGEGCCKDDGGGCCGGTGCC